MLVKIDTTEIILCKKLKSNHSVYLANEITQATIDMYNHVIQTMLPTPAKMHYLFNLRDISKVKKSYILYISFLIYVFIM